MLVPDLLSSAPLPAVEANDPTALLELAGAMIPGQRQVVVQGRKVAAHNAQQTIP
jgi:hypothetical protein